MAWGVSRRPREWAQLGGRSPGLRLIAVFFFLLWKRKVILAGLRQGEDVSEVLVCYSLGVYETQSNPQATRVIA
jgi:hypothetical protein